MITRGSCFPLRQPSFNCDVSAKIVVSCVRLAIKTRRSRYSTRDAASISLFRDVFGRVDADGSPDKFDE